MKPSIQNNFLSAIVGLAASILISPGALWAQVDGSVIEEITGLSGERDEASGVFKVSEPREDVAVAVDGRKLPPFLGLTSWAAFAPGKEEDAMVMGDLVLFEDEVNAAMSAALDNGVWVTALHNHFFFDEPKVYFMHIGGEGSTEQLAKGVRAAFDAVKAVRGQSSKPAKGFGGLDIPETNTISAAPLEEILGRKGTAKDGMFKISVGRDVEMECGCKAGGAMGVASWAAFGGSDDAATVDGDFAVLEGDLQAVLKSLRSHDINIVAIHNHMILESPRIMFLHYWGKGKATDLAKAVESALTIAHPNPTP